jgi:3-oxoacyl-[acyl-carrier protein] reductase
VNIVSLSADRAVAGIVPYGATKAGLVQLTKGLAVELGPLGVRVNAVAPGYVTTPMTAAVLDQPGFRERVLTRIPLGRLADGGDIADVVAFLASPRCGQLSGIVVNLGA